MRMYGKVKIQLKSRDIHHAEIDDHISISENVRDKFDTLAKVIE